MRSLFSTKLFVFRKRMTTGYLISDVHIVNVTPRVPTKDLVALQCNLFTVDPWEPHVCLCVYNNAVHKVCVDGCHSVCSHTPTWDAPFMYRNGFCTVFLTHICIFDCGRRVGYSVSVYFDNQGFVSLMSCQTGDVSVEMGDVISTAVTTHLQLSAKTQIIEA